jgi:hypothetical protein
MCGEVVAASEGRTHKEDSAVEDGGFSLEEEQIQTPTPHPLRTRRRAFREVCFAALRKTEASESPGLHAIAYELSRTVNDAGRDVPGRVRRHQRCHQRRRRWTRTMNFLTA